MMDWIRESISDEHGVADVAYVSLFIIVFAVLGAIAFVCLMSAVSFCMCHELPMTTPPTLCRFDPQPLGIAVGAICTGFATALGALAAYMAATRPPRNDRLDGGS